MVERTTRTILANTRDSHMDRILSCANSVC
jgi:hypothetical protein